MVQSSLAAAGIVDGRRDFRAVFCALLVRDLSPDDARCERWLIALSDDRPANLAPASALAPLTPTLDIVFIGGIFGECLNGRVDMFSDAREMLMRAGYRLSTAPVRGRAGSAANAAIIRSHILQQQVKAKRKLLLIAYSKGASDALVALAQFPELADHVAAVLSIAGVVNGSPLADNMVAPYKQFFADIRSTRCPVTDGDEIDSLTTRRRFDWLTQNSLPPDVRYFSIVATPAPDRVSLLLQPFYRQLAFIDPLNDGQMVFSDAVIPGGRLLGYMNADHWAIALPFEGSNIPLADTLLDKNRFPRAQMLEAAVREVERILAASDQSHQSHQSTLQPRPRVDSSSHIASPTN